MLNLAQVQTRDALYTNESIHFNNQSPIWHQGPSSTLHPGTHWCFKSLRAPWLSDQLFLIRSSLVTKEDFLHKKYLEIFRVQFGLICLCSWTQHTNSCAQAEARSWRMLALRGEICLQSPSEHWQEICLGFREGFYFLVSTRHHSSFL